MLEQARERKIPVFNLHGAYLRRTDFSGASLRDANLERADFTGALFRNADFKDARVSGTILRGADLSEAVNLTTEQLEAAIIDQTTRLPDYVDRTRLVRKVS